MRTFLFTLHILTCVSLIIVVLIQRGKGSDMGAMLGGGGSNTVFGARGAGNFLTKLTTSAAIIFMVTSLSLSYLATQDSKATIFDGSAIEETIPAEDLEPAVPAIDPSLLEEIEDSAAGGLEEIEDAVAGAIDDATQTQATPTS
jgi:preprotein translocase subunit SecG